MGERYTEVTYVHPRLGHYAPTLGSQVFEFVLCLIIGVACFGVIMLYKWVIFGYDSYDDDD